jgi:long-chain-alcohol oxidase
LVRDRSIGFVDGKGRVRFTPSRKDIKIEELCNCLHRTLRILVPYVSWSESAAVRVRAIKG